MIEAVIIIIGGVLAGGAIGSFIGCAIYRVPRGISIVSPASKCPACGHVLTPRELIPIASFLMQRGRARCCGAPLSAAYFWAELLCAALGGALAALYFI